MSYTKADCSHLNPDAKRLKDTVFTGQENNLPHHFITDKDWYIHVVVSHTQTDLRYRLVDKEKRNIHAY